MGDAMRRYTRVRSLGDDDTLTVVTSQLPVEHWHEIIGEPKLS